MNDAIKAIECCKPWRRFMLEICKDVVLYDRQPRLFSKFKEPMRDDRRKRRPVGL